jgi:hypothetical protein
MDMPDLKPVEAPKKTTRRLILFGIVAFIVAVVAYAYWINLPGWQ